METYFIIDAGNSSTKTCVFDEKGLLLHQAVFRENDVQSLQKLAAHHQPDHVIVSTTGKRDWLLEDIPSPGLKIELTHHTKLPIRIVYTTPETLGRDRIAGACGAFARFPDQTTLVIDVGTCITMDVVLPGGIFIGGNIAPGIRMRLVAMHERTAKLPLVEPDWPILAIGDSTRHALQNGACLGAQMEIEGILHRVQRQYGRVRMILTGGDAAFLANRFENEIFVAPDLVARGLFEILQFNVRQST